jgi:hypothetical protein
MFKMISNLVDHSSSQSVDELDEFSGHDWDVALLITYWEEGLNNKKNRVCPPSNDIKGQLLFLVVCC